jgi:hypothetical protein
MLLFHNARVAEARMPLLPIHRDPDEPGHAVLAFNWFRFDQGRDPTVNNK